MLKHLFIAKQYVKYYLHAKNAHGIHSPFVFDFIENVIQDNRHYYAFDDIELLRNEIYHNNQFIEVEDFGAGSHLQKTRQRKISQIAKIAGRSEKFGKLLFRIVIHSKANQILELGTSLGLGTSYLASARQEAQIHTIEGSKTIAAEAKINFNRLQLQNITQHIGNFDEILLDVLEKSSKFDLIFIDGNHQEQATLRYFQQCLPFISENSIIIFDDIHWSQGMLRAWEKIKSHDSVRLSIDLFYMGVVFFEPAFKEKQHFVLKY